MRFRNADICPGSFHPQKIFIAIKLIDKSSGGNKGKLIIS